MYDITYVLKWALFSSSASMRQLWTFSAGPSPDPYTAASAARTHVRWQLPHSYLEIATGRDGETLYLASVYLKWMLCIVLFIDPHLRELNHLFYNSQAFPPSCLCYSLFKMFKSKETIAAYLIIPLLCSNILVSAICKPAEGFRIQEYETSDSKKVSDSRWQFLWISNGLI